MTRSQRVLALKKYARRIVDSTLAPRPTRPPLKTGAPTVVGLFAAASGIGESARLCFNALQDMGLEPDSIDLSTSFRQRDLETPRVPSKTSRNTGPIIIHLNPPEIPRALHALGQSQIAGRKIVGYWAWELPIAPPDWVRMMRFVHEVWTPSSFCSTALSRHATVPVRTVPHVLPDAATISSTAGAQSEVFHVIATGDTRSSLSRKNLEGSVHAFQTAFGNDQDVRMSVRIGHSSATEPAVEHLQCLVSGLSNVHLVTELKDEESERDFIASADAVLSLHRSEGFGLVLAKAMRRGRPVIATAWSGNMEFMTRENACLVGFEHVPVNDLQGIYSGPDQTWAEPNQSEAVDWLRKLRSDSGFRASLGQAAARLYPADEFRSRLRTAIGV